MRATSPGSVQFIVGDPSSITNVADLVRYVREFEQRSAAAFALLAAGHLDMTSVMPAKPSDGDIRYFDGVIADPGSGKGMYYYDGANAIWQQLG